MNEACIPSPLNIMLYWGFSLVLKNDEIMITRKKTPICCKAFCLKISQPRENACDAVIFFIGIGIFSFMLCNIINFSFDFKFPKEKTAPEHKGGLSWKLAKKFSEKLNPRCFDRTFIVGNGRVVKHSLGYKKIGRGYCADD